MPGPEGRHQRAEQSETPLSAPSLCCGRQGHFSIAAQSVAVTCSPCPAQPAPSTTGRLHVRMTNKLYLVTAPGLVETEVPDSS